MPRLQLLVPLLRPLAAPRASACRHRLQFSTGTSWRAEQPLQARPAPADNVTPDHALNHPTDTTTRPKKRKANVPKHPGASQIDLPPPAYHVAKSNNGLLPVYTDFKRGGNLHLTIIRKITGDLSALRDELKLVLGKKDDEITVHSLTSSIHVKHHHKKEIREFLAARGF